MNFPCYYSNYGYKLSPTDTSYTTTNVKLTRASFVAVADLPGLIEGSHVNRGLGISFLRHIQRCTALLLLVDITGPSPWQDVQLLRNELTCFSKDLADRPQLIIANKIDVPGYEVRIMYIMQFEQSSGC